MNIAKRLLFRKRTSGDPAFIISILSDGAGAFTIPTRSAIYTYLYDVEVVGGSTFTGKTGNFQVTGLTPSTAYDLRITGTFPTIYFNGSAVDRSRITGIKNWGNIVWSSFTSSFRGCTMLNGGSSANAPNLSIVTSLTQMFQGCELFNQAIGDWDVSNVTNMNQMFRDADDFNQPIGDWNTANVTAMDLMFRDAASFDQPIGNWNTGNVTTIEQMFRGADSFDQSAGNWDITSVTNAADFMTGITLSTANYDATIGWAALSTPTSGLTISFGSSKYTNSGAALAARNTLTTTYTWNITDGGGI